MRSRVVIWLTIAALVVGAVVFYQFAQWSSRGGDNTPLYSLRRHDPYGTAALYDLLQERGVPVRALERPHLEQDDHGTLVQVLPLSTGNSPFQETPQVPAHELMDWMADGNTVIQFSRGRTALMDAAGVPGLRLAPPTTMPATMPTTMPVFPPFGTIPGKPAKSIFATDPEGADLLEKYERAGKDPEKAPAMIVETPWMVPPEHGQPETVGPGGKLLLLTPRRFPDEGGSAWHPIAEDHLDAVAGVCRVGRGRLIVVGAPTPALNYGMSRDGNLDAVLAMIGPGPVIFDEWSHGVGQGGTVMAFLRRVGLMPVILQVLFILCLYNWSTRGHRRRDDSQPARRRSTLEQVETLGYLYSQSLTGDVTHSMVRAAAQRRMSAALRCRPEQVPQRVATLKPELQQKARQIVNLLRSSEQTGHVSCYSCGYDLTGATGGKCPECGAVISRAARDRIDAAAVASTAAQPSTEPPQNKETPRRQRIDKELARVLTLSHEFAKEIARDRNTLG